MYPRHSLGIIYTPHKKVKHYLLYYEEHGVRSSVLPGFKVWCWEFRYS